MKSLADASFGDELFGENDRRYPTEIKPNHIMCALYRLGHSFRFFNRGGERLFTENDFSGFSSGDRNRRMQRVGTAISTASMSFLAMIFCQSVSISLQPHCEAAVSSFARLRPQITLHITS